MNDETTQSDIPTSRMLSWARNSTIYRLERRMMTEKQLFDAIARKAKQRFEGISEAQLKAVADYAVQFAYDQNALNDETYAVISVGSGIRSGKSKRIIAQKLTAKGVDSDTVEAALEDADDLLAALAFGRKRGFGPFRRVDLDEKRKAKELSAFVRNGFSFSIGKAVFDMSLEDAEAVIQSRREQHQGY